MNYRDNAKIPVGKKALDTESHMINMALYNKTAVSFLMEIESIEFMDSDLRELKNIIGQMVIDEKMISPTTVYNEINSEKLKQILAELSCGKISGDPETIYLQFKKWHRMVSLEPDIIELQALLENSDPRFDEKFEETADKFSNSKVMQDATIMKELFKSKKEDINRHFTRFKTGIPSIDNKVKWLYTGQYISIAAPPGEGKSTLAGIIAERIPNSLIMSYEMTCAEWHDIMVSRKAGIDSEKIEDDLLDFHEKQLIDTARRDLAENCTLRINDKYLSARDMFAFIKIMKRKHDINCVVIDYAQIVPGLPGKGSQTEKYEWLSRKFKQTARELNIILIALSQLDKSSIKEGRAPNLSDLRGSLSFASDADKVIFLYSPEDEPTRCSFGKNRKGRVGLVDDFYYNKPTHYMR